MYMMVFFKLLFFSMHIIWSDRSYTTFFRGRISRESIITIVENVWKYEKIFFFYTIIKSLEYKNDAMKISRNFPKTAICYIAFIIKKKIKLFSRGFYYIYEEKKVNWNSHNLTVCQYIPLATFEFSGRYYEKYGLPLKTTRVILEKKKKKKKEMYIYKKKNRQINV